MKLRRSLYARPVIVRGEQCAEARLGRQNDRAAGWSCGRQSRAGRWPTAEPSWLPSAAGTVHRNTVGWPSARPPGRGGPGGADAGRAFVSVSVSSASVRSPLSGAGVPASRVPVQAAAVRCPVRASERPGVRCPAWVSSVRGFPRPLCPTGRLWKGRWGRQPHGWDGRRRRGRRPCPRPVRRLLGSEPGGRGWRRPCWASGGVGLDFAVVVGAGRGSGWVDRVGNRDGLDGRGDRPLVASRGAQRSGDYAAWSSCAAQGRVAWSLRASWSGLRLARAAVGRPQNAVSAACSTLTAL
jgi:hypothetical protein